MVLKIVVGIVLIFFGIYHVKYNKRSTDVWIKGRKRIYNTIGFKHVAKFQDNPTNVSVVKGATYVGGILFLISGCILLIVGIVEIIYWIFL